MRRYAEQNWAVGLSLFALSSVFVCLCRFVHFFVRCGCWSVLDRRLNWSVSRSVDILEHSISQNNVKGEQSLRLATTAAVKLAG